MISLPTTDYIDKPVFRYTNDEMPENIRSLIDFIDFYSSKDIHSQVLIFFKLPATDSTIKKSYEIGKFIMSKPEWIGDRSLDSVAAEIYIHWVAEDMKPLFKLNTITDAIYAQYVIGANDKRPSPICPTHLGCFYKGMNKSHPMDQFLLAL